MLTQLPVRPASRLPLWPWRETDGFENRLRTMFEAPIFEPEVFGWTPLVDVEETDDELKLTAELPGMDADDVEIDVEGNTLILRGEKAMEAGRDERDVRIWERHYGRFSRAFTLPGTVDIDSIRAEFDKGVLTVHMPKTVEARGRRIAVKTAK